MRITLVSAFDPNPNGAVTRGAHVGGVERVFWEVSRHLAGLGHDVTLVCSTEGERGSTVEEGVLVIREPRRGLVLRAPVARLARRMPPGADVIQVAATYPFTTPAVLRRARELRVPSVLDFHFEPAPGTPLGRLAARMHRRMGTSTYTLADAVLVRSLAYAHAAPTLAHVPPARWRVVPNGIDPARFNPGGDPTRGEYLLFVGRLVPYKGLPVLLRALARLPAPPPLLIAGDGPLRRHLESLARRLHLAVRFLGHVPDAELAALYRGACLTLLPSVTRQEAFGMSLLESMACGTPVVASDLPGVADVALRGGFVAPPGDPDALAHQIQRALGDAALPRGATLSRQIHAHFSWEVVTDRLLEVYEELMTRDRTPIIAPFGPEVTQPAHTHGHPVL